MAMEACAAKEERASVQKCLAPSQCLRSTRLSARRQVVSVAVQDLRTQQQQTEQFFTGALQQIQARRRPREDQTRALHFSQQSPLPSAR